MSVRPSHHRLGTTAYIPEHPARYPVQKSDDSIKVSSKLLSPKYSGRHKTTIPELWEISSPSPPSGQRPKPDGHAQALPPKTKAATRSRQITPCNTKRLETVSRNPSTHAATLTVTHPSIPSLEGKHPQSNHSLSTRKQRPNLPSREGPGVCDVRAQLPKIKAVTRSLTDNTLQYQASRNCIPQPLDPCRDPHRNTPLNPLSRGETSTPQTTHYQKETSISNLPSREGQGVCDVRAQLPKIKSIHPEAKKHLLTKQQQKHLIPHRAPHRNTPLKSPLKRGNHNTINP